MRTRKERITYRCEIPDEFLSDRWNDLPVEVQEIINRQGGLPCDSSGMPGDWCNETTHQVNLSNECYWVGEWDIENEDE
jgi:hypothetical protein